MHYHMEIIMPPTDDIEAAVSKVMAPFNENADEDDEDSSPKNAFWDWWQIGGRYSGSHVQADVPQEKMDAFVAELNNRKVTVSGLQFGKQELSPASQIPMVDALWREMCPGAGNVCPIFKHSGDEKNNSEFTTLKNLSENLTAHVVIIATPQYDDKLGAGTMLFKEIWNGVSWQETTFDGKVSSALAAHKEKVTRYREDFQDKHTPKDDWIVVTVDYHS